MNRNKYTKESFLAKLDATITEVMPRGNVAIKTVADAFIMSPSQFSRRVKSLTGITPAAYILNVRMDEAKRMLAESPRYTMLEVAQHCGFADNAHFTHAFRRQFGVTPTQYAGQQRVLSGIGPSGAEP